MEHAPTYDRPFPWRAAAGVLAVVALAELAGLLALAGVHVLPGLYRTKKPAAATATQPGQRHAVATRTPAAPPARTVPAHPLRPRSRVSVLVLNGNGVSGDAGREAETLLGRGYRHAVAANAKSHDYARSLVLFAPGWQREGKRLGRDAGIRAVSPLDGMKPSQLRGSQLVVILGDS